MSVVDVDRVDVWNASASSVRIVPYPKSLPFSVVPGVVVAVSPVPNVTVNSRRFLRFGTGGTRVNAGWFVGGGVNEFVFVRFGVSGGSVSESDPGNEARVQFRPVGGTFATAENLRGDVSQYRVLLRFGTTVYQLPFESGDVVEPYELPTRGWPAGLLGALEAFRANVGVAAPPDLAIVYLPELSLPIEKVWGDDSVVLTAGEVNPAEYLLRVGVEGGGYEDLARVPVGGEYVHSGLESGREYRYVVKMVQGGVSSSEYSFVKVAGLGVPSGVEKVGGVLSWLPVEGAGSYVVGRRLLGGLDWEYVATLSAGLSPPFGGGVESYDVGVGGDFEYRVAAVDVDGVRSAWSKEVELGADPVVGVERIVGSARDSLYLTVGGVAGGLHEVEVSVDGGVWGGREVMGVSRWFTGLPVGDVRFRVRGVGVGGDVLTRWVETVGVETGVGDWVVFDAGRGVLRSILKG